jgi:hypothetical protein
MGENAKLFLNEYFASRIYFGHQVDEKARIREKEFNV